MEKNKGGRPKIIKTPEELMSKFESYIEDEGYGLKYDFKAEDPISVMQYISIKSFMIWLDVNTTYWYEMTSEFSQTKKRIEDMIEEHLSKAVMKGDIDKTFTIFYFKNKFGYSDKTETINTNKNLNVDVNSLSDYTDEELEAMLNEEADKEGDTRGKGKEKG